MTQTKLTKVKGIMKKILQTREQTNKKTGRPFSVYGFVLKPLNGERDLFVNSFKQFDKNLLSETVEVEGTMYNDTTLNLKAPVVKVNGEDSVEDFDSGQEILVKPKRRGRPKVVRANEGRVDTGRGKRTVYLPSLMSGREAFRKEAEDAVVTNLQSAQTVLQKLKLGKVSVADLVAVGDMIGRTQTAIFMDHNKDRRMREIR